MSRMIPRRFPIAVTLSLAVFVGCENVSRRSDTVTNVEPPGDPLASGLSETPEDLKDAGVRPGSTAGFFKPSRRAGGWSREAREIEGHFNIQ